MKKFLLSLSLITAAFTAYAQDPVEPKTFTTGEDTALLTWEIIDGTTNCKLKSASFGDPFGEFKPSYDVFDIPAKVTNEGTEYTVTVIGASALRGQDNMLEITVPNTVKKLEDYAFYGNQAYKIHLPESIDTIGEAVFYKSGITEITIPNSVKSMGNNQFSECTNIAKAILGDGLTKVGNDDFYFCDVLEEVVIGKSVKSIYGFAFYNTSGLSSVTCYAPEPPVFVNEGSDIGLGYYYGFFRSNLSNGTVYVPAEYVEVYKADADWCHFNIEAISTDGINEISADTEENAPAVYYNLNGSKVNGELTPGLYIVRNGAKASKVIVK